MKRSVRLGLLIGLWGLVGCSGEQPKQEAPSYAATYEQWAIACDQGLASDAGAEMLALGGNAVDAAVAASFCLSVVRPFSCGIGGGGFMVISLAPTESHPERKNVALDYREVTPAAIGPYYFDDLPKGSSERGAKACAVPGTVAGLLHALAKYGTLDRETVLAPAIRVAREGFPADSAFVIAVETLAAVRKERPDLDWSDIWPRFAGSGRREIGDVIVNELQAQALELIARDGASAFYEGPIADAIVAAVQDGDGVLSHADLRNYAVRERPAVASNWGPWRVLSMPPPSSAGIAMQQVFGLLERMGGLDREDDQDSAAWRHMYAEASKHAFADRARWLADDTFSPVPIATLTAPGYLDSLAATFDADQTRPSEAYGSSPQLPRDGGTSHISVIDAEGLVVACTETINLKWGSCVAVPGFGFLLNDEMDDFKTSEAPNAFGLTQSDRNRPEPGKRPLSSMSPTIVLRDDQPVAAVGASGGPRIISGTLQVLLSALVFGDDAGAAVSRPRMHHQWQPDELRVETAWDNELTLKGLRDRGHNLVDYELPVGVVQALIIRDGRISAASDPRKGGRPAGR